MIKEVKNDPFLRRLERPPNESLSAPTAFGPKRSGFEGELNRMGTGHKTRSKKNENPELAPFQTNQKNANVGQPVARAVQPENLRSHLGAGSDHVSERASDLTSPTNLSALHKQKAMTDFAKRMKNELGIEPDKIVRAFNGLSNRALQESPEASVEEFTSSLRETAGLNSEQTARASALYTSMLNETSAANGMAGASCSDQQVGARSNDDFSGAEFDATEDKNVALTLASLQQNLNRSIDDVNQAFGRSSVNQANSAEQVSGRQASVTQGLAAQAPVKESGSEIESVNAAGADTEFLNESSRDLDSSALIESSVHGQDHLRGPGQNSTKVGDKTDLSFESEVSSGAQDERSKSTIPRNRPSGENQKLVLANLLNKKNSDDMEEANGNEDESQFLAASGDNKDAEATSFAAIAGESLSERKQASEQRPVAREISTSTKPSGGQFNAQSIAKNSGPVGEASSKAARASSDTAVPAGQSEPSAFSNQLTSSLGGASTATNVAGHGATGVTPAVDGEAKMSPEQQDANLRDVVKQAQLIVKKGGGEMSLELRPEGVGQLHLKVSVENGQVNVQMLAETDAARKMLQDGLHELKASLAAHKLTVDSMRVDALKVGSAGDVQKQMDQQMNNGNKEHSRQAAQDFMQQFRDGRQGNRFGTVDPNGLRSYATSQKRMDPRADLVSGAAMRHAQGTVEGSRRLNLVA